MRGEKSRLAVVVVLGWLLALGLGAQTVQAPVGQGETMEFVWLAGAGFICGLAGDACPTIAMAPNGDTIEISGSGTFGIHPKFVTGGGTFEHNFAGGGSVTGTWTATQMLGFNFYGAVDLDGFVIAGGLLVLRVVIDPDGPGPTFRGVVWIDCLVGEPPAGAVEGVRLNVPGAVNFNKEVSGLTVFVLI